MNERIDLLMTWAPFLLEGFALNVLIATCATVIGTLLGGLLALLRFSRSSLVVMAADRVSSFFRNIPTLVLMFYLATLIPNEVAVSETLTIEIPKWLKAAIAMCASPLGFTSWNLHTAMLLWKAGNRSTAIHAAIVQHRVPRWGQRIGFQMQYRHCGDQFGRNAIHLCVGVLDIYFL